MRIVFAGTPEFGIPCLEALFRSHHELIAIYTQPDRPAGRGQKIQESAVKTWGINHQIPLFQPLHFKSPEVIATLAALEADIMIVIAYGLILPQIILNLPRFGCINVHASLLPKWRGAAPIQHAILAGDSVTGISIMQMDAGMDTGAVYTTKSCSIAPQDSSLQLQHHLSMLAPEPLLTTLEDLVHNRAQAVFQDPNQASYAPKIHKQDASINWQESAVNIDRKIKAYYPWPIAYTQTQTTTIRIHQATLIDQHYNQPPGTIISIDNRGMLVSSGQGGILITTIQCPGGRPIKISDYCNAPRPALAVGTLFQ